MIEKIHIFCWKVNTKIRIQMYKLNVKIFRRLALWSMPDHGVYSALDLIAWDFRDAVKDLEEELDTVNNGEYSILE